MIRKRLISMLSAVALVLSLFTLLPQGVLRVEALTDSFTYRDAKNIDWYCRINDGNVTSGDVLIGSVSLYYVSKAERPEVLENLVFPSVVYDGEGNEHTVTQLGVNGYQTNIFEYNEEVKKITLPDTITTVFPNTFNSCSALEEINIPKDLKEIKKFTFYHCLALKSITLPDGLETIGQSAFDTCPALTEVTIPDSVTKLGISCFSACTSLTGVELSSGLTAIPDNAFRNCDHLTSITIPSSVTKIGTLAFDGCTRLMTVYIPASVTEIGADAFAFIGYGATIYGYSGSYAETYANENSLNFRAIDTQVNALGFSEITMENGTMAYTARNGRERTGITELTASTTPGLNDIKKGTTVTMTPGEVPEEYEFKGYEVTYDFTATVNGTAYHVYYKTLSQTADENTFLVDVPAEAKDRLIPFIIMKLNSSNPKNISVTGTIEAKAVYEKVAHDLGTLTFDLTKALSVTNDDPTLYTYIDTILHDNHPSNILEALFENGADPYKYTFMVNIDKVDTFDVYISVKDGKLLVTRPEAESASGEYTLSMKDSSIAAYKEERKDYYSKLKVIFPSADTYEPADFGTMTLDFVYYSSHVINFYDEEKINRVKATLYALGKSGRIGTNGAAAFDMDKDGTYDIFFNDLYAVMASDQTVGGLTDAFVLTEKEIGYVKDYYRDFLGLTTPAKLKAAGAGYHGKLFANFPEITVKSLGVLKIALDEDIPSFSLNDEQNYAVKAAIKSSTEAGEINSSFSSIFVDVDLDKDGTVDFDIEYYPLHNKNYMFLKNPNFIGTFKYTFTEDEIAQLKAKGTEGYYTGVKITLSAEKRLVGDINGDGVITADDAIIAARLAAGYGDYSTRYDAEIADINQDGKVTADDAIIIARYAAGYGNYREIYTNYI